MALRSLKGSRRKILEELNDFSGGMNTVDTDTKIKTNELRVLKNVDIDSRGQIKKRRGFVKVEGHTLPTGLKETLDQGGLESFERLNENTYYFQTTNKVVEQDEVNNDWNNISTFRQLGTELVRTNTIVQRKEPILTYRQNNDLRSENNNDAALIDNYDLENKGFNLWLNYYYDYDTLLDFFKHNERKILKNLDLIGYDGVTDILIKKTGTKQYLIKLLTSSASDKVILEYKFELAKVLPELSYQELDRGENSFFELNSIPNIPFKLRGTVLNGLLQESLSKTITTQNKEYTYTDNQYLLTTIDVNEHFGALDLIQKISFNSFSITLLKYNLGIYETQVSALLEHDETALKVPDVSVPYYPNTRYSDLNLYANKIHRVLVEVQLIQNGDVVKTFPETTRGQIVIPKFVLPVTKTDIIQLILITKEIT